MAAIQMPTCTAPRPSSRNQPHLSINSKIPEKVTFPGSPIYTSFKSPGNNNMRFESSSPTASSNISPVQYCALHPDSPYEILTKSPSNSAPSLRLTLSNNGSDNSDGSAWGFIDQGTSSPGSAGANSRQQSLKNAERLQQAARSRLKPVLKRYVQQSTPRSSALITAHSDIDSGACALKVDNVPNLYSGSFECSGPQGEGNSIFHSLDNLLHPPDPAALQAFNNSPADSEEWFDLPRLNSVAGPGQLLNGRGFGGRSDARGSKQLAETVSGDSNLEVEDSCRQEVFSMDTVLNTEGDSSYRFWWLDRVLYSQNQVHSLDPKPLLGIPSSVGSPHFSWPNHIQTAAPLSNLGSQSNFEHAYGKQVNSAIASLKATLPRSSTSSKSSYSSLRAPSGLSVPPVTRPRGQKRPIEDHQYEVPKSTSTATYPAVRADLPGQYRESTSHTYSSKLILPQQGVSKKIRHQRLQSAAATNNISNIDRGFNFQPQLAATSQQTLVEPHLMPFSMDCKSFTHEQPEAENFNPSTGRGSAEYLALPNCTTQHPQPVIDMPPQPHVDQHSFYFEGFHHENQRYHPSQVNVPANYVNTWNNSGLGFGLLSTPGREGVSVSPIISVQDTDANMEESHVEDGSEINSFHLDSYGQWGPRGDIDGSSNYAMSSNQVSPSPVNTPNESPGLGPTLRFGPPRPPPPHLTVQHPHCNVNSLSNFPYVNEDTNASYPNASLGGNLQWVQDQAAAAVVAGALSDWTTTPCFYPQQLESMALGKQDSGEDYEAEDERFDVDNEPDTARTHFHHGLPQKKRRRPFENDRRIAVHNVRKLGACVRCQYLRESCDEESPCGKCREVGGKQKIWGGFGCIRLRITEAQLFRKGNSKFKQERALPLPTPNWKEHVEKKYLILGRPPPIAVKYWGRRLDYPTLRIRCQEFIPRKDDLLFETWNEDGEEIRLEIPAFAACELEDVSIAVRNYVRETFDLFKYDMLSEEHNPLIRLVFQEAIRYTETHQCVKEKKEGAQQEACMLKDALKIWILTRLAYEGFTIISGNEEFGVNVINNPKSPYNGTVPIPPILDHQLDTVGIQEMIRLKANVLKALKARIQKRRTIQWYEVFLTIFVLLHNLEYISRKQYFYMKRHEGTWASNGERSIDFFREKWLAEWETAANMLIKHFQVALKGSVPFTFNWQGSDDGNDGRGGDGAKAKGKGKGKRKADPVAEAKERAGMDEAGVKFMREVCELVHAQEADFQKLRQDSDMRRYDNELVWVSQLFLDV